MEKLVKKKRNAIQIKSLVPRRKCMRKGVWKLDSIVNRIVNWVSPGKNTCTVATEEKNPIAREIPLMCKRNNFLVSTEQNVSPSPVLSAA